MRTCIYCGEKNFDTNTTCSRCGQAIYEKNSVFYTQAKQSGSRPISPNTTLKESALCTIIKVLMVFISVATSIAFLLLISSIIAISILEGTLDSFIVGELTVYLILSFPFALIAVCMTRSYFKKIANYEHIGIGFKICTILFIGILPGILMLCDTEDGYQYVPIPTPSYAQTTQTTEANPVERLTQYKELLDKGIITQEEFDAKKKEILGL